MIHFLLSCDVFNKKNDRKGASHSKSIIEKQASDNYESTIKKQAILKQLKELISNNNLKELKKYKEEINSLNYSDYFKVLKSAVESERNEILRYLLGLEIKDKEIITNSILFEAIKKGNIDIINLILPYIKGNPTNYDGMTPLHVAAMNGSTNTIDLIFNKLGNINALDKEKRTALHIASMYNNSQAVTYLLEKEADTELRDNLGNEYIHLAVKYGNIDLFKSILQTVPLEEKAKLVNKQNQYNDAPLHIAIKKGDIEMLKLLLKEGANTNILGDLISSPLGIAISKASERYGQLSKEERENSKAILEVLLDGYIDNELEAKGWPDYFKRQFDFAFHADENSLSASIPRTLIEQGHIPDTGFTTLGTEKVTLLGYAIINNLSDEIIDKIINRSSKQTIRRTIKQLEQIERKILRDSQGTEEDGNIDTHTMEDTSSIEETNIESEETHFSRHKQLLRSVLDEK